jgi:putative DNA primase/helicase
MHTKAEDLVYDRWPDILMNLGMDPSFFSGKHGPCPFCGGKDRYRWAKRYGGTWVCSQCTADKYADGFKMLMQHLNLRSFAQAADTVRAHFGEQACDFVVRRPPQEGNGISLDQLDRNRQRMNILWSQSTTIQVGDPVWTYLQHRVPGLTFIPSDIQFHPALEYWNPPDREGERPVLLGRYPAMLARALSSNGQMVQLHKTYLTQDGLKAQVPVVKKTERGLGINSFAIRAMPVTGDTLGVSEGIESGLAGAMLRNIPVWPCLNGPVMSQFQLPAELSNVRRLLIFADHDELKKQGSHGAMTYKRPGTVYADQLATRAKAQGLRVMIIKPARVGQDMADQWSQIQLHAKAAC